VLIPCLQHDVFCTHTIPIPPHSTIVNWLLLLLYFEIVLLLCRSFRVSCANSTSANVLTYANTDCSGTPVGSILFPSDLGCETSGPTGSFNLQCIDGEFEPPSPSANTYVYSEIYSCPATSSDVLNVVYSYQCGTCFDYGGGKYASYACNSRSVLISFYTDSSCSDGATDTYIIQYTGCAATSQGVSVTECNMGDNVTSISNGKPFVEFKALPIATATQSVRDAAHAKVENAVASALAQALN